MLLGNYNQWNANVGREFGSTTNRVFKYSSVLQFVGSETNRTKAAFPNGYYPPYSLVMPFTVGTTAGRDAVSASAVAAIKSTVATTGDATITALAEAVATLLSSTTGEATVTATAEGVAAGVAITTGDATVTATGDAAINAYAFITASASCGVDAEGIASGTAHIEGESTTETALSPATLAAALWDATAASYNATGTMGAKLNAAGSGGVDYDALKEAVWGYSVEGDMSAEGVVRVLLAVLSGTTEGIGTTTEKYKSLDGTTDRINATFDAAGNRTSVTIDADV